MQRAGSAALCHSGDAMRVVHWNVRRCVDLNGVCSRARMVSTLEQLRPAVVTLNEVDMRQTPTLLEDLSSIGLSHASFFGHVRSGSYGNLVASCEPLHDVEHTHLDGGTEVLTKDGMTHRIARGLLSATISMLGIDVRVAVTHLDHMSSRERRRQTQHLLHTLNGRGDGGAALVIGDLNSLRCADYTDDEWAWHHRYNDEKQWGAPVDEASEGGVLALLAAAKFADAYAVLEQERRIEPERRIELERRIEHERRIGESQPSWRAPPWTAHVRDEARPPCRIDYVHSRPPSAPGGRRLVPLAAAVESNCGEASDHQPLVLDFEATAFDAGE
jgi:endonuclease/exonuclease/phosphatase family metal-dependent hydrolase